MSDVPGRELKFENRAELEAWLGTQPREVCVVIATRAALRVVPMLSQWPGRLPASLFAQMTFATLWANATALVGARYPTGFRWSDGYSAIFAARRAATNAAAVDPAAANPSRAAGDAADAACSRARAAKLAEVAANPEGAPLTPRPPLTPPPLSAASPLMPSPRPPLPLEVSPTLIFGWRFRPTRIG